MMRKLLFSLWIAVLIAAPGACPGQDADVIDWNRARQLLQRSQRGDTLEPAERAYLERARSLRQRGARPEARASQAQRKAPERLIPLCDMTASDSYEGEEGRFNPEPYAYESAFAARRLILEQSLDDPGAPLLRWGPYLWAEGEKGRKIDDVVYTPADFVQDGVHPSASGREKVARQLLNFFRTNPLASGWFRAAVN
jgi:hypothetical protein